MSRKRLLLMAFCNRFQRRIPRKERRHAGNHLAAESSVSEEFTDKLTRHLSEKTHTRATLYNIGSALRQRFLAIRGRLGSCDPETHRAPRIVGHTSQNACTAIQELAYFPLICDEFPFLLDEEEYGWFALKLQRKEVIHPIQRLFSELVADLLFVQKAGANLFRGHRLNQSTERLVHQLFKDEAFRASALRLGHSYDFRGFLV